MYLQISSFSIQRAQQNEWTAELCLDEQHDVGDWGVLKIYAPSRYEQTDQNLVRKTMDYLNIKCVHLRTEN